MKKLLTFTLVLLLLAATVVTAFAESDGTPLTLDVSSLSKYIYLGPEKTYYDEDGYIMIGRKEDTSLGICADSYLTFQDLTIFNLDAREDTENVYITLDGENEIIDRMLFRNENFVFNAIDEDATLVIPELNSYGGNNTVVWNGGNLKMDLVTDDNYPTLNCGVFILNGGTATFSNDYYYVSRGDFTLNGGRMNLISTSPDCEAINNAVVMNTGALLTVSSQHGIFYHTSTFSKAEGLGADYSFFVRFDTESDFVPVYDVADAVEDVNYAEIKVDLHKHAFENNTCVCGLVCTHTDMQNGLCNGCGFGVVAEDGIARVDEDGNIVASQGLTAEQLIAMANDAAVVKNADGTDLEADKKPGTGTKLVLDCGIEFELVVIGDVDGDGEVSSIDARNTLRNAVGLDTLTDAQLKAADFNSDGSVSSVDARGILRRAVGLPDETV
ncbi:MAG: hypothetical protein E7523_05060 [Ruminococcaceae bacterium]|nr:hypothetical protein [Oscillospiraceae bacterium]